MAMLRGEFARRWPVAVLAGAVVAALSLGDVVAGWYSFAGRGPSAAGEYPVRIVLRPAGGAGRIGPARPAETDTADGAAASAGGPSELSAEAAPDRDFGKTAQPVPPPATDGLLAIQFDLADPDAFGGGSAIEIRKAIRLNGSDAGEARIRVGASSTLSIAREELGRLLAQSGQRELLDRLGAGERFVSFDEIRREGIEVRYDPVSDRILVST